MSQRPGGRQKDSILPIQPLVALDNVTNSSHVKIQCTHQLIAEVCPRSLTNIYSQNFV